MSLDPVVLLNLAFDILIVVLAILLHQRIQSALVLGVAGAFGLFAISYALTIADVTSAWILVPIRTVGYLCVILGLLLSMRRPPV